jgi:hypothetical protein
MLKYNQKINLNQLLMLIIGTAFLFMVILKLILKSLWLKSLLMTLNNKLSVIFFVNLLKYPKINRDFLKQ